MRVAGRRWSSPLFRSFKGWTKDYLGRDILAGLTLAAITVPEQMATANAQLTGALGRLLAVVENYPNLKADQSFIRLQDELAGTENRIAVARNDYNGAVNTYNAYIRQFPQVLTAKVTGAKPRKYFTAAPGSTEAPKVDFSKPSGTPAPATRTP